MTSDPWGRVDEQGNVYVRTAEGERLVGSWAAGSPEEALAYYERKYTGLLVEVDLLEHRVKETDLTPKDALHAIGKLRENVVAAKAVGDLESLTQRLDALLAVVKTRRDERKAAKAHALDAARAAKERIVDEAEQLATSTDWRQVSQRLTALVDEWKAAPRLDRRADDELWHRFSQARSAFSKRRKAHFAALDSQREEARERKEKLVDEAESLASSTDWSNTAARFRDLMRDWKTAGRAQREVENDLWNRFRNAQDAFFTARSGVLSERDSELKGNQTRKEELLRDAEALLPVQDVKAARAALRALHERWEEIGHVPRDARSRLEGRLHSVERAIHDAEESEWRRTNPEARARAQATVNQLQASIDKLQIQAERARSAGNQRKVDEAQSAIAARQEWLEQAKQALSEFTK